MAHTETAALEILEQLERLAPRGTAHLYAARERDKAGQWIVGLKDSGSGAWVAVFTEQVTMETAGFMAQLYNECHNLLCFARLGLDAAGITKPPDDYTCKACGSAFMELAVSVIKNRTVQDMRCLDCDELVTQIGPAAEPLDGDVFPA